MNDLHKDPRGGIGSVRPAFINTLKMSQKLSKAGFTDEQARAVVEVVEEATQVVVAAIEKMFGDFRREMRFYALVFVGILTFMLGRDIVLTPSSGGGAESRHTQAEDQQQSARSAEDQSAPMELDDTVPMRNPLAPPTVTRAAPGASRSLEPVVDPLNAVGALPSGPSVNTSEGSPMGADSCSKNGAAKADNAAVDSRGSLGPCGVNVNRK